MIKNLEQVFYLFVMLLGSFLFADFQGVKLDTVGASFVFTISQSLFFLCFVGPWCLSLIKVYFVFSYVFLSLIPWLHYSQSVVLWGGRRFSEDDYLVANGVIFFTNAVAAFVYSQVYKRSIGYGFAEKFSFFYRELVGDGKANALPLVALSTSGFLGVLYLNNFSFSSLFFKGLLNEGLDRPVESSALLLMFGMLFRLIPFFCFLYAFSWRKNRASVKTILFLMLVLSVFPTGVSRYMVAFVYVPIFLIFFPRLRRGFAFPLLLVFSIFFVFPFLNQFRHARDFGELSFFPDPDFFVAGHFDAYQNFMRVMQLELVTSGNQLLGVLLFFVPREMWGSKPVGSGYYMSEIEGYEFSNISMPFLGEGYINFGLVGAFFFLSALAVVLASMDKYFLSDRRSSYCNYPMGIYLYLCGALVFVLRGDLLSSFAYVVSGLVAAWVVKIIVRIAN